MDVSVTRGVRVALHVAADCSDEHMVDCLLSVIFLMFSFLQQICANESQGIIQIPTSGLNVEKWDGHLGA